jgi:F-box protein 11
MGQDEKALADFDRALALNSSLDWVKNARGEIKARLEGFVTVDSSDADYRSISDAIKHVPEKTRILVRPGTYRESIVLDKNVEIVGDGPREQIVLLSSNDASCIRVATDSAAVVRGTTIHGRAKDHCAIDIPRGRLHMSDCIVTCETQRACIEIHNSTAQPLIEKCIIRDGGANGILVYDQGAGVIEDCDISNNKRAGVVVERGGDPLVRRCQMHDGQASGIYVQENGKGTFEDCDISNNKLSGVSVKTGGDPLVRRCQMHDGQSVGIFVYENGKGTFEDCDISNNKLSGVSVETGGDPLVRHCKMHDGQQNGIWVYENGKGTFEECETFANKSWGLYIEKSTYPVVLRCTFQDGEKRKGN